LARSLAQPSSESAIALLALPSYAQPPSPAAGVSGEFERPFGCSYGEEQSGYDANTRDANGNRVISITAS
jgi:hypothetical protein